MAPAFEEWAVVVHTLLEGEQVLDMVPVDHRDDGDDGAPFPLPATRLWLVPAAAHQQPELLKEPYRHWIDLAPSPPASPAGQPVRVEGWADVVRLAPVSEQHEVDAIGSKVIWTPEYAGSRFGWQPGEPLWVLALRVHRLLEPVEVARGDASGLPDDPASLPSEPALSDVAFEARLKGAVEALPSLVEPAAV